MSPPRHSTLAPLPSAFARLAALASMAAIAFTSSGCKRGGGGASGGAGGGGPGPLGGPTRKPDRWLVEGERPAVRDASSRALSGEKPLAEARLLVSKLTPADGIRLALRFPLSPLQTDGGAARQPSMDWARTAESLVFTVHPPSGPDVVLQLQPSPRPEVPASPYVHTLSLSDDGLFEWGAQRPWKQPPTGLLARPGAYTIRVEGKLHSPDRPAEPLSLPAIPFQVVAPGEAILPLDQLAARARAEASSRTRLAKVSGEPPPVIVDDVKDNRWVRLQGDSEEAYQARLVDVLLTPSGQLLAIRDWSHFTCVAQGTTIATPRGPTPVEQLQVGDEVLGLDVARNQRALARVEHIATSLRDELVELDGAWLTPEHPVLLDGTWRPAVQARPGSIVIGQQGSPVALKVASLVGRHAQVFDLTVSEPHTFFAGGLLVHNKAVAVPLAPGDPWNGMFIR